MAYDSHGNLQSITDTLSYQVTVTQNSQGLPTIMQDALTHRTQFGYLQADISTVTMLWGGRRTCLPTGWALWRQ